MNYNKYADPNQNRRDKASSAVKGFILVLCLAVLLVWFVNTVVWDAIDETYNSGNEDIGAVGKVSGEAEIRLLGTTYEGNAKNGYSYYLISVPVTNVGDDIFEEEYDLSIRLEAESYNDIEEYYDDFEYDALLSACENVIPVGLSGMASRVYLIRDGVEQVTLSFYSRSEDYYDETEPDYQTVLPVPKSDGEFSY